MSLESGFDSIDEEALLEAAGSVLSRVLDEEEGSAMLESLLEAFPQLGRLLEHLGDVVETEMIANSDRMQELREFEPNLVFEFGAMTAICALHQYLEAQKMKEQFQLG